MSLEETKKRLDELKNQYVTESKEAFFVLFKEYFEKYPQVNSVTFQAYTDYFCDGDPCTYGVHAEEYSLSLNGISEGAVEYEDDEWDEQVPEGFESREQFVEISKEASHIIYSIDSDVIESVFGDHVEVTIKRDGYDIEEYTSHD